MGFLTRENNKGSASDLKSHKKEWAWNTSFHLQTNQHFKSGSKVFTHGTFRETKPAHCCMIGNDAVKW